MKSYQKVDLRAAPGASGAAGGVGLAWIDEMLVYNVHSSASWDKGPISVISSGVDRRELAIFCQSRTVKADRTLESGSIDTESQQDRIKGRVQRRLEVRAAEERVQAGLAFLHSRRSSGDGDGAQDGSNRDDREAHFGCLVLLLVFAEAK